MNFFDKLHETFVVDDRWQYLTNGLKITLLVTFFASLLGVALGFLIAIVRSTHDKTGKLPILNAMAKLYLTVYFLKIQCGYRALDRAAGCHVHKRRCLHGSVRSYKLAASGASFCFYQIKHFSSVHKIAIASPKEKNLYFSSTAVL